MIEGRGAREIAASVERAVDGGELAPGAALPPIRELATRLGVNPNTVAAAYRALRDRGVIETAGRRGSRVRDRPVTTSRGQIRVELTGDVRDVASGNPAPAMLPPLADAFAFAAARQAKRPTLYGADTITPELAAAMRAAWQADGIPYGPLTVTSGALDAIERVLSAHLRPGDAVAVEDPGWGALLDLVTGLGLRAEPVAVDDEGPLPDATARALRAGARALVVTCRAQNPTGAALSAERADRLRSVAAGFPDALLVEDDHGHGIAGLPPHSVAGVGPAVPRWAHARSVAKAYGPDLRLAVLTGDADTVGRVSGRQRLGPGWVSHLLQDAVVRLWETGAVDLAALAAAYGRRRRALIEALRGHGIEAHGRSGVNVWVPVPDETAAVTRLVQRGWAVAPGARFRLASGPGVRVTVSTLEVADIAELADALAFAVAPAPAGRYD